jgi:hypothetical protein
VIHAGDILLPIFANHRRVLYVSWNILNNVFPSTEEGFSWEEQ